MKVAILGAGGLVGSEFTRQYSPIARVLPVKHSQLDITDHQLVREVLLTNRPDLVINCAVLGIDECEKDPPAASTVNTLGAEAIAKAAAAIEADLVQMSTNFVFGGNEMKDSFLTVEDEPQPINVYGQTKLAGERAASAAARRCFIIRTSWVFGKGKLNFFSSLPHKLGATQPVRAINDVWANATYVQDLVSRVIDVISRGRYGTYHIVNSGVCSYYDFARETGRLMGMLDSDLEHRIEQVTLSELQLYADRPRYTPMRCLLSEKLGLPLMRHWKEALSEYVQSEVVP
jgi:dTDP-4-dehydrorhamnose reductase